MFGKMFLPDFMLICSKIRVESRWLLDEKEGRSGIGTSHPLRPITIVLSAYFMYNKIISSLLLVGLKKSADLGGFI